MCVSHPIPNSHGNTIPMGNPGSLDTECLIGKLDQSGHDLLILLKTGNLKISRQQSDRFLVQSNKAVNRKLSIIVLI